MLRRSSRIGACSETAAYAVKINFPLLVSLKRYSRPACSMISSPWHPSNSALYTRRGLHAVVPHGWPVADARGFWFLFSLT